MNILTQDELTVIQMALADMIDNMSETITNPTMPWTPKSRNDFRDMIATAQSAKEKLAKATGHEVRLDRYEPGDEQPFFTKPS